MLIPITDLAPIDPTLTNTWNEWIGSKWTEYYNRGYRNSYIVRHYFVPSDFNRENWLVVPDEGLVEFANVTDIRHFSILIVGVQITGKSERLTNVEFFVGSKLERDWSGFIPTGRSYVATDSLEVGEHGSLSVRLGFLKPNIGQFEAPESIHIRPLGYVVG